MSEHLIAEEADVEAKFGSTLAITANLKEQLFSETMFCKL